MYEDWMEGPDSGFSLMAGLIATKSRGNLRLSSCDPHARALLNPNILADTADLEALKASVRQCREIGAAPALREEWGDRKSTRLNSSHVAISYAVFCLKKKKRHE